MLSDGVPLLLFLCLSQAHTLPLASQLSEEDEKVTKCITEILADTLSKPSPVPVTSECMKILREDERVLALLHHQHLLAELEDLVHQENAKHHLGHEEGQDVWEGEGEGHEDLKKWEKRPSQQRAAAAASENTQERDAEWKEDRRGVKEYQKTEKIEEKVKEVSHGKDDREALEEEAKGEMEDESEEDRLRQKKKKNKKKSSSETWSSREYFGHVMNRGSEGPKIREVMLRGSRDSVNRNGLDKRSFESEGEGDEYDSSEEEPKSHRHGGHHHKDWEDEEEGGERRRRRTGLAKRVAEKASDEETAQFEEEEKGVKVSNSKDRLHGGWKPWPEEEEKEGEMRYRHHHKLPGLDLKKRHQEDYPKGRRHGRDEDEGEAEASRNESQELEKLEEIEHDLRRAAQKLRELKRVPPVAPRHGKV